MADDIVSNLMDIKARIPGLAEDAVKEALGEIFEASQGLVPVDTGLLKSTGEVQDPVTSGGTTTGAISYGSEATRTNWHGIGYEIFVHTPGTKWYGGVPYLEQPMLDAKGSAGTIMAESIKKGLS